MKKLVTVGLFSVLFLGALVAFAQANASLTGEEILDQMQETGSLFSEKGDAVFSTQFDFVYADGTEGFSQFTFYAKQGDEELGESDFLLIYYQAPEDIEGTIFLTHNSPDGENRLWLFLPALGLVKELVSEGEKEQSFGGTNLTMEQIGGGFEYSDDYDAERLPDETVFATLDGVEEERTVYVLQMAAKADTNADYPTGILWVDVVELLPLRTEFYNELGNLEVTLDVFELETFEGDFTPTVIESRNVLDESKTTITVFEQRRIELPEALFDPTNLPSFDPASIAGE